MTQRIDRRRWIAGSVTAAAMAGCAGQRRLARSGVSIVRAPAYDQRLYETVRRMLAGHRLDLRDKTVVLKPNLVEFEPDNCINTNPLLVHAVYEGFRALGVKSLRIAEGPGHRRNTLDLADAAGYFKLFPDFEAVFTDLNLDDVARVRLRRQFSRLERLYLPRTALSAGLLVSLPKMKTHHWVGATLSMKNLFGVVPGGVYGWPKNVLHWSGIGECIADLHSAFPNSFAIVDGIVGMEGNGPIQGTPKPAGVLVAGRDLAAVDATCCRIMGIDPFAVEYLKLAALGAAQIAENGIEQMGEPLRDVSTSFELIPEFRGIRVEHRS